MKERPILFSGAMARALLDGSKTQTRRIVKDLPPWPITEICHDAGGTGKWMPNGPAPSGTGMAAGHWRLCPYGQPGERLWVRESWAIASKATDMVKVYYRASEQQSHTEFHEYFPVACAGEMSATWPKYRPSIHMPRWASRILLEIVSVRVERLNECSRKDAIAEGIHRYEHVWRDSEYPLDDVAYEPVKGWPTRYSCPIQAYQALWDSINGAGSWDANPWVWVVEFKRVAP